MTEFRAGKVTLNFVQGDITESSAAAIVNAANNHLWMGAGVAGAIKKKGGVEIEQEAVAQGPIAVGEAVVTTAGRLKARYVIHAAGMGQDLKTDAEKIYRATYNSLLRAGERELGSIVFPAIGTGVGGFSAAEAAHAMITAVLDFAREHQGTSVRDVHFALFDARTLQGFEAVALELAEKGLCG